MGRHSDSISDISFIKMLYSALIFKYYGKWHVYEIDHPYGDRYLTRVVLHFEGLLYSIELWYYFIGIINPQKYTSILDAIFHNDYKE
jgi:hypothetical protein